MSDIVPMDIAKTANTLGRKYALDYHPRMVIARAILAERERCADVAFDYFKGDAYGSNYIEAGNLVGTAILAGETP